jgi:thioredoxin reductase (NADPH)
MSRDTDTRAFTVLSRAYCHLCHELFAALEPLAGRYGWSIEVIDIDRFPELEARWGERVPVLLAGDTELCHYHLDENAVHAWCQAALNYPQVVQGNKDFP